MTRTYDLIFFDADQTLFDFRTAERLALRDLLQDLALPADEEQIAAYSRINEEHWRRHENGELTRDQLVVERFASFLQHLGEGGLARPEQLDAIAPAAMNRAYEEALSWHAELLPEAEETLAALAPQYRLALVTNGLASVQHRRLSLSPITRFFEGVFISEELGYSKPDPRFFDAVFARLEKPVARERCLLVGDSVNADMRGAYQAGLEACWFSPRKLDSQRFPIPILAPDEPGPGLRRQIHRLHELQDWLLAEA